DALPILAVRNYMFSKVAGRFVRHFDERFFQYRPTEDINPHGCQIALWLFWFFLEIVDASLLIRDHDSESAGLLDWNRHCSDGHVRIVLLVEIQHHFIIHYVNMVS